MKFQILSLIQSLYADHSIHCWKAFSQHICPWGRWTRSYSFCGVSATKTQREEVTFEVSYANTVWEAL